MQYVVRRPYICAFVQKPLLKACLPAENSPCFPITVVFDHKSPVLSWGQHAGSSALLHSNPWFLDLARSARGFSWRLHPFYLCSLLSRSFMIFTFWPPFQVENYRPEFLCGLIYISADFEAAIRNVGDPWTPLVLMCILFGPHGVFKI